MVCVVTDYVEPELAWEEAQYNALGIELRAHQLRGASTEEVAQAVSDADIILVDQARIDATVLEHAAPCKLIIRHGDGYDNLDVDAATRHGIVCANKPGFWSQEVAELTVGLSMALFLKLPQQLEVARNPLPSASGWDIVPAMPQQRIRSKTIGLFGYGKIGRNVERMLRGLCQRVLVYDPFVQESEIAAAGAEPVTFETLLAESDLVSIHTPATSLTRGLFDGKTLGKMKRGAFLVNTARGSIVDLKSLEEMLVTEHLAGAALDVTSPEPLPSDHRLHQLPNVLVTPHLGWYSEEALWNMRRSILEDVKRFADGQLPDSIVNPDVLHAAQLRFGGNSK